MFRRFESALDKSFVNDHLRCNLGKFTLLPRLHLLSFHLSDKGELVEDDPRRFASHNFRHSLPSSLVKLRCDPKTVQGILRHEDVRTTMQLYAQSD